MPSIARYALIIRLVEFRYWGLHSDERHKREGISETQRTAAMRGSSESSLTKFECFAFLENL